MRVSTPTLLLSVLAAALGAALLSHAGPLDAPGGPPAPTYKTLAEVEPRTPLSAATTPGDADSLYRITTPGSYYLTGNITGESGKRGIEIAASNVTIDLMGFAVQGVPGSLEGIATEDMRHHLIVRNGAVNGWGADGINLTTGGIGANSILERVIVSGNAGRGVWLSSNSVIARCVFQANAGTGILTGSGSTIADCTAQANGGTGIALSLSGTAVNCTARGNAGSGIATSDYCTVTGCSAYDNGGIGIYANRGSVVTNCTSAGNTLHGLIAPGYCLILDNAIRSNGNGGDGAGIYCNGSDNRIEGNNIVGNDWGVWAASAGNFIARNTCSNNATNWEIVAGNACYIVQAVTSGAISGNAGGVSPGSSNPNANYTY